MTLICPDADHRREPTLHKTQHAYASRTTEGTMQRPRNEGRPQRGPDTKRSVVPGNLGEPTANGEFSGLGS